MNALIEWPRLPVLVLEGGRWVVAACMAEPEWEKAGDKTLHDDNQRKSMGGGGQDQFRLGESQLGPGVAVGRG